MSKKINLKKPLEGFDAQYVRDRPWLIRDAELEGIKVRFADDPDGDFEVEDEEDEDEVEETEETEEESDEDEEVDYNKFTVKELTAEIDARNEDRAEADEIVPDSALKADLVAALVADDEANEEDEDDSNEE